MIISLSQDSQKYGRTIFDVVRIFLPHLSWKNLTEETTPKTYILNIEVNNDYIEIELEKKGKIISPLFNYDQNEIKRSIKLGVYKILQDVLEHEGSPWGILTGIRPTKIVHRLWDQGYNGKEIKTILQKNYLVSNKKSKKLVEITKVQRSYLLTPEEALKKVSIYISIPFCPTKCHYCSFPSFSLNQWGHQVSDYLKGLKKEIKEVGQALKNREIKVETIYIGGGTPTILTTEQLASLLEVINTYLCSTATVEFTVEAGRPDTIDEDKLVILKDSGVDRISINPQTMWEPTLMKIGRTHSVQDVLDKMYLAWKVGFKTINMDLIIGLPGEGLEHFKHTLKEIEILKPNNLTVHTLAIKRTAKLKENTTYLASSSEVEEMFNLAESWTLEKGYQPYYLYRQKQILANLENVGYSFPDFPCVYNIQMMEERQTIWGLGVGSGSKIVNPKDWTLVNTYNPKDLLLYNQRLEEFIFAKVDKIQGLG